MQSIISLIPNINVFVYVVNAILLLTMITKLKLTRSLLLLFTMASTVALLKIDDHLLFITMWVWTGVLLFITSLHTENNISRKHHFSQYATYIIADLLFFFMSLLLEVKFGKFFLIIPIIVRCNLIPFQFFSCVGNNKNLKNELLLISINFLTIFIFLHKFNVDSTLLIKIITISLFLTSFRFIRNASSTNTLTLLYVTFLNMCVFLALHGFTLFAHAAFIFFLVVFSILSQLIPDNISENTLRHVNNFRITPEKIYPIIILSAVAFLPLSFSSTIFLSVFELITFKTWYVGQNHTVALLLFALILWFLVNIHCAFTLLFNLTTHLPEPQDPPTKYNRIFKFGLLLPIFIFLISPYLFTGYFTFVNSSQTIPIQNIIANADQYILFFFTPILLFSLFGVYLRKLLDLAKFLLPIYSAIFKMTSLYYIYTNVSFSNIQIFISKAINMFATFIKIISRIPIGIFSMWKKTSEINKTIIDHAIHLSKKILEYELISTIITDNYHIILISMTLLIIAFSSTLSFSIVSIVLMTLTSLVIGYFLSTQNEDTK